MTNAYLLILSLFTNYSNCPDCYSLLLYVVINHIKLCNDTPISTTPADDDDDQI